MSEKNTNLPIGFSIHNEILATEEVLDLVTALEDNALEAYGSHPKEMHKILKKLAKAKQTATEIRNELQRRFAGN